MESLEDGGPKSKNFLKHVFNFDEDSKGEILNVVQYSLLSIIPVVILNKSLQKLVPEADEEKGNLEILAEVVIQVVIMFVGLLIIHRIITFVPTYSGMKYPDMSIIFIILATLMITLSLQTKLGEKVSILSDRVTELWEGKGDEKEKKKKKKGGSNVKVSQPISQPPSNQTAMNQAMYTDGTSISQLPVSVSQQQLPNYNEMYRDDSTPLVNASSPSMESYNEPMAANSVLGGGGFSSW